MAKMIYSADLDNGFPKYRNKNPDEAARFVTYRVIDEGDEIPSGWHDSPTKALAPVEAEKPSQANTDAPARKKRGRKKKVQ